MSNAHDEQWKKLWKIKTLKTHCETLSDKPEHILNIIVQGSDNKILLINYYYLLVAEAQKYTHSRFLFNQPIFPKLSQVWLSI